MVEKKYKLGDKEIVVKEIPYVKAVALDPEDRSGSAKQYLLLSTDLTEEEVDKLSIKDGLAIQKIINEVNGLEDFTVPSETKSKEN